MWKWWNTDQGQRNVNLGICRIWDHIPPLLREILHLSMSGPTNGRLIVNVTACELFWFSSGHIQLGLILTWLFHSKCFFRIKMTYFYWKTLLFHWFWNVSYWYLNNTELYISNSHKWSPASKTRMYLHAVPQYAKASGSNKAPDSGPTPFQSTILALCFEPPTCCHI